MQWSDAFSSKAVRVVKGFSVYDKRENAAIFDITIDMPNSTFILATVSMLKNSETVAIVVLNPDEIEFEVEEVVDSEDSEIDTEELSDWSPDDSYDDIEY